MVVKEQGPIAEIWLWRGLPSTITLLYIFQILRQLISFHDPKWLRWNFEMVQFWETLSQYFLGYTVRALVEEPAA